MATVPFMGSLAGTSIDVCGELPRRLLGGRTMPGGIPLPAALRGDGEALGMPPQPLAGEGPQQQPSRRMRSRGTVPGLQSRLPNILRGQRVLVTGGAGFLGSHVVELLVQSGCSEIVVLDNLSRGRADNLLEPLRSGRVHLVVGDIRNEVLIGELMQDIDTVFHQAALRTADCAADPRGALEVMVNATFNLFECAAKSGVRKIVLASSASVYGMAEAFPTTERHSTYANRTLYGAAKCFAEGLLRAFSDMYGTRYVALRYFDLYGPRMDMQGRHSEAMIRWMERLAAGQPPVILGDGRQTMDLLHVHDAARASLLAALTQASDVVLNIGSGEETSQLGLARQLSRLMGYPDIEPIYWEERTGSDVPRRRADTSAARRTIGFEPRISLADGLAGLVEWWRGQSNARQGACG